MPRWSARRSARCGRCRTLAFDLLGARHAGDPTAVRGPHRRSGDDVGGGAVPGRPARRRDSAAADDGRRRPATAWPATRCGSPAGRYGSGVTKPGAPLVLAAAHRGGVADPAAATPVRLSRLAGGCDELDTDRQRDRVPPGTGRRCCAARSTPCSAQDYPGQVSCVVVPTRREPDLRCAGAPAAPGAGHPATSAPWAWPAPATPASCAAERRAGRLLRRRRRVAAGQADRPRWRVLRRRPGRPVRRLRHPGPLRRPQRRPHPADATGSRSPALLRDRLTELHPSTFLIRRALLDDDRAGRRGHCRAATPRTTSCCCGPPGVAPVLNAADPLVGCAGTSTRTSPAVGRRPPRRCSWLLDRYPEFAEDRRGQARLTGQIAFARRPAGERATAWRWAGDAGRSPVEPRAWLALAIAAGALRPDPVLRALHRRGRGV